MKTTRHRPFFRMPLEATFALIVCYIALQSLPLLPAYIATAPATGAQWLALLSRPEAARMRFAVLIFGSLIYGLLRVTRTHPAWSTKYAGWLATVPWNSKLPLPLGPVNLVWEDMMFGFVVTALSLLDFPTMLLLPIAVGLIPYAVGAVVPASAAGRKARLACNGIAITFAGLLPASGSLSLSIALIVVLLALLRLIVDETMLRLPWESLVQERASHAAALRSAEVWPLAPRVLMKPIDALDGGLGSATLGWITFCIAGQCESYTRVGDGWTFVCLICGFISITRLLVYAINFAAPISPLGRLFTGQWIIPSYDKIWVAPVVTFVGSTSTFAICVAASMPLAAATALAVGVAFAIALNMGPSRRNWQLTGHHRIIFKPEQNQTRASRRMNVAT